MSLDGKWVEQILNDPSAYSFALSRKKGEEAFSLAVSIAFPVDQKASLTVRISLPDGRVSRIFSMDGFSGEEEMKGVRIYSLS
jgi:hypothetical protein